MMYRALESFTTKNYDVRRKQLLEENFTTQEEIQDLINVGYIEVDTGSLKITQNGQYNVNDYDMVKVNVEGSPEELIAISNLADEINGEVI